MNIAPSHLFQVPRSNGKAYQNLRSISAVNRNAIDYEVQNLGREDIRAWDLVVVSAPNASLYHCHTVHGQCPCLIGADGCGVAHCLTSVQVPYQVVVPHHFLQRKRERS